MEISEQIKAKTSVQEIHISRVPKEIRTWFIDYSHSHFCGDYGLCLKHVIDTFRGMTPVGYYELESQLNELRIEMEGLKLVLAQSTTKKKRTMADGTAIE